MSIKPIVSFIYITEIDMILYYPLNYIEIERFFYSLNIYMLLKSLFVYK